MEKINRKIFARDTLPIEISNDESFCVLGYHIIELSLDIL